MSQDIIPLLKPARSLVLKFTEKGSVFVSRRVRQEDGGFAETALGSLTPIPGPQAFTIGVDGKAPALVVDRFGHWEAAWDEELVHVLGGEPFPFGNEAVGVADEFNPKISTRKILNGTFSNPPGAGAQIEIKGLQRNTVSKIPPAVPEHFFALLLTENQAGYVKFPGWPGGEKEFRSA